MKSAIERALGIAAAAFVFSAAPSFAEAGGLAWRYATVFDGADGTPESVVATCERAVIDVLLENEFAVIEGRSPEVITALDADRIFAATISVSEVVHPILTTFRFDVSIEGRAIAVDTRQTLWSRTARGAALGFSREQAIGDAAKKAARELARELPRERTLEDQRRDLELSITGVPGARELEAILDGLRALPNIKDIAVLESAAPLTKLILATEATDAASLAAAIDELDGLLLRVAGTTQHTIKTRFDVERVARLVVNIAELDARGSSPVERSRAQVVNEAIAASLSNLRFLDFSRRSRGDPGRALRLAVVLRGDGKNMSSIDAKIVFERTGVVVSSGRKRCEARELSACAASLGDELAAKLADGLCEKLRGACFERDISERPLAIEVARIFDLFPARAAALNEEPAGFLTVKNHGREPLRDLRLSAELRGFSRSAGASARLGRESRIASLAAGATIEIPIYLQLDGGLGGTTPAIAALSLVYRAGDLQIREKRSQPLLIHSADMMSWSEPASIAAFVDTRDAALIRTVLSGIGENERAHVLSAPAAVHALAGALALKYTRDKIKPFRSELLERVRYPWETLAAGGGDCDDLAVFYAAMLFAAGSSAILVATPAHLMVAAPVDRPVLEDSHRLLHHAGRVWIPLDPTMPGSTLREAWDRAAELIASAEIIDLEKAWRRFPPSGVPPPPQHRSELAVIAAKNATAELRRFETERSESLSARLAELSGDSMSLHELSKRSAVLAALGREKEAREVLAGVLAARRGFPPALNNLANLELARGEDQKARALYDEALAHDPRDAGTLINAAIAAHLRGDAAELTRRIADCLEAGAGVAVEQLARAGGLAEKPARSVLLQYLRWR